MAEISKEAARAKGVRFQKWAEEDGLYDALDKIKQAYLNAIVKSHPTDTKGRENCYIAANVVDKIRNEINVVIGEGKLADAELKRIEKEETKKSRFSLL